MKTIKVSQIPDNPNKIVVTTKEDIQFIAELLGKPLLFINEWKTTRLGLEYETGKGWSGYFVVDNEVQYVYYKKLNKKKVKKSDKSTRT